MTKPYPKSNRFILNLCFVLLTLTGIIYGCRKDILKDTADTSVNSTAINQARSWYEKTYPQNKNITAPKSLSANSTAKGVDLSQLIKPDWQRPESYNRLNREVIEIPIDPTDKFSASLTNLSKTYNKAYSRTSFLILKNGSQYEAYVMTIMADSAYVRNDLSKLAHNTYRSHDADFSGVVAYFTPKGKFVGSYGYKNGKLLPRAGSTPTVSSAQKTQNKKTIVVEQDPLTTVCVYWYMGYYEDGVLVYMEYLYKECYGGGGDSGGTSPAQPPPCIPASTSMAHPAINADLDPIGSDPGPGDGGFPPPPTPIMINCEVVVPPADTAKIINDFCDNLSTEQKATIVNTVKQLQASNCAAKYLYNKLVQGTSGFTFCISGGSGSASYSPVNKSINFTTDYAASRVDILEHEMFHGFQDMFYPNGTAMYGKNPTTGVVSPGFSNIEFEQAVFNDIINNSTTAFDKGTDGQKVAYQNWLSSVTNDFTTYPKLVSGTPDYTSFMTKYNSFFTQFNTNPDNPLNGPTNNLNPDALISLFNNTNCN